MKKLFRIVQYVVLGAIASSCQQEIQLELPPAKEKFVVEGRIQPNLPPIVVLTKTSNYFDPVDSESFAKSFVKDAKVWVDDGETKESLLRICSQDLSGPMLEIVANYLGIDTATLLALNLCAYSTLSQSMFGEVGKNYKLTVEWNNNEYNASSVLHKPVELDSVWYKAHGGLDSLGFVWAQLSEPGETYNWYRWRTQRINSYTYGENKGQIKDFIYVAPRGSVFDDRFINGVSFDFWYNRARVNGSNREDDQGAERGYFKRGDTVAIEFSSIDYETFKFITAMERQVGSNGNPFASPINVPSNISGGALGLWAAYGIAYDTVVCQD